MYDSGSNRFVVGIQPMDAVGSFELSEALVFLDLPLGVKDSVISDEVLDLCTSQTRTIQCLVSTPHGDSEVWDVILDNSLWDVSVYEPSHAKVFPNPASNGYVNIKNDGEELMTVAIYNTMGQCVFSRKDAANTLQVSTSDWHAGLYLVKITQGKRTVTKKLTISQ